MQVFNIKVDEDRNVKTSHTKYHVPAHANEDLLYTIHPDNEDDYDLKAIEIKGSAFTQTKVNRKTILMHDDNVRYWEKGDTPYKYTVVVIPVGGQKELEEDPTIVNQ